MLDGLLLLAAFLTTLMGMGWLALAMNTHWRQVRDDSLKPRIGFALRSLGSVALLISLLLCLSVDHASMASLVWIMLLGSAAMTVAFTLTLRPQWLHLLLLPLARTTTAHKR